MFVPICTVESMGLGMLTLRVGELARWVRIKSFLQGVLSIVGGAWEMSKMGLMLRDGKWFRLNSQEFNIEVGHISLLINPMCKV